MRLHLPRRLARDELRAWVPGDAFEDLDLDLTRRAAHE
jgi:hypothetical protein